MVRNLLITVSFIYICAMPCASAEELEWVYTVRPNDTVQMICERYTKGNQCSESLVDYNELAIGQKLSPGLVLRMPISWMKLPPVAATVVSAQGTAYLLHDNGSKTLLAEMSLLRLGDRVLAESQSLTIKFPDATMLVLQEGAQLKIVSVSAYFQPLGFTGEIYLSTGSIRVRVPQHNVRTRFRVRTPAAVAAVRGTEFRVDSSKSRDGRVLAREEVLEGVVAVAANDYPDIDVPRGFGLKVAEGMPPPAELSELPAEPRWIGENAETIIVRTYPFVLSWAPLPDVRRYRLDVFKDNADEVMVQSHTTKKTQHILAQLPPGCYRVRVHGIDDEGFHGLNAKRRLCLAERLATPRLQIDDGKSFSQSVFWQSIENAQRYRIELSKRADFATVTTIDQQATEFNMASLGNAAVDLDVNRRPLYMRVQALHEDGGGSAYSDTHRIGAPQLHDNWKWLFSGLILLLAL